MKNTLACFKLIFILLLLCSVSEVYGQLSGVKKIPGDYASITLAVADLNTNGVGAGGVTFDVAGGYLETLTSTISLTATGTAENPIIFRKDPATPGNHPLIRAYSPGINTPSSSTQDGIWRLIGSDYVTIDGIDLEENPANTSNPSTMEYGYALYKASTSNGCQYVTITNCVISLSNLNNDPGAAPMVDGSTGIIVMNATATAATIVLTPVAGGTNSYNKFYGNTIQYCNTGIALIGYYVTSLPSTLGDTFNEIGGNTALTGNSIVNYGGAPGAIYPSAAIRTSAQYNLNASFNTINNNNGGGTNHPSTLRGIYLNTALSASATITNNTVTLHGGGTADNIAAIENLSGAVPAANTINISKNIITNSTYATATTGGFTGILNNAANPQTLLIRQNTITNNSSAAPTTGFFYGIHNSGLASTVNIDSNLVSGNSSTSSTSTGNHIGIYNTGAAPVLNITSNTVANNVMATVTGLYYAITNSGAVTGSININSNNIGTVSLPAVSFPGGSSVNHVFINNAQGGASATLSISDNRFNTVAYSQQGTGANTYISNLGATRHQVINNNTFTNMDVNTTGAITFIANSVAVSGTGTQNVNNNSISGTFTKSGIGATLTLFSSTATSVSGSVINNSNNNFSNITVLGATTISGWVNTDLGASNKFIQNNTFSNWTGGTGAVTAMNVSITGINNATSGNIIENITSAGAITGISTSGGNDNIFSNSISALSTSGTSVIGISAIGGTKKDIYRNKVYNLQADNVAGIVAGISISGSAIVKANVNNNLIADLRAPKTSSLTAIAGINAISSKTSSAINIFYNTIYLNAVSSGASFGSSGIYHVSSATATTAALDLRNNIIVNTSTPTGTGLTVAFRRSLTTLANYATTSNNNLFYAGPAATNRLLSYDGTNQDQTLSTFKARVTPREALSVTEDITSKFLSTSGSSPNFLHLDPSKPTQAESGAVNVTNYTTDYDAQTRQGNAGYAGTGTGPDIGADEFAGIPLSSLLTTYNVGVGETFTSLTNAGGLFASINSLGLTGNLVANITSDLTEDGTNSLYQWAEQGTGNYTVTIRTNTSSVKMISGNVSGPLIRLSGVKRLIIDGSNGTTTNYLTFRNTNPGGIGATALTLVNGASNTMIRYCNFEANAAAPNGVIVFSTSTIAGGNSNNTITNCGINATVNSLTGSVGVYSAGSGAGFLNTGNIISNNSIYNYRDRGLDITATGSNAWVISGNSLFNGDVTGGIDYAASSILQGIRILGGSGYSILNNYIGGNAAHALGTPALYSSTTGLLTYLGISLKNDSAKTVSNIKGNTIANLSIAAVPLVTTGTANLFFGIETNGAGVNIGGSTAGEGNMIGSGTVNGSILLTTTTSVAAKTNIRGISCSSTGGLITGNQVGGIDIRNLGGTTGSSAFIGIYLSAAAAPTQVSSNIIGSTGAGALANSIRVLSSSIATATSLTGINIGSAVTSAVQVTGNIVENVSYQKTVAAGALTGISNSSASSSITITGNTIRTNTMNGSTGILYGFYNSGATASLTISTNLVTGNVIIATTATMFGVNIASTAVPATVTVSGNTFSANTNSTSSGAMTGISNLAPVPNISITGNIFNGNVISSTTGQFFAINSSGGVTTSLNINSNEIGTSVSPAITYTVANSAAQTYISVAGATAASSLSISNNNFYSVLYSVAATSTSTSTNISVGSTANSLNQSINSNKFFNLNLKTGGNVTLISNNSAVPATGTQNVNNNSISGTFTKSVTGGTVTFFSSSSTSAGGAIINNNDNNFSNVSVMGTTVITGFVNTDPGTSTRTLQNNTFTNWTAGTGAVTAMSLNLSSTTSSARSNIINNITGAGAVTGISTAAGNDNIISNTINTLSTSGGSVTGISVTAGTSKNILRNKIYDLSSSSATGMVNGILVSSGLTVNIVNNLIGDLRAPIGNASTDVVRGISITSVLAASTINIYYNTIYLNAVSSGANFSTAGIYHLANATATIAVMNLRNNSITNTSTPKGTGTTAALRRSTTTLANYALTSNNNLFYAGAPAAGRLIYSDGTNLDQTLANFKTRVSTRETSSVSEDLTPKYITTTGSSPLYLHMNTAIANALESGAANVEGFTVDYDGQVRAGNPGYSGASVFPDIGADEIFGIENVPPTITYTLLENTTATTNRVVTGVSISDISGVNNNPGTRPRIYYKRLTDGNVWLDNTPSTSGWKYTESESSSSPYSFTIDYSLLKGGAEGTAGIIQYFIVAQDLSTVGNVGVNSGTFATPPTSVALGSAAFPIGGTINSFKIPFSGSYKVGSNEVFTSLTRADGLFSSINSVGLAGSTTFNITSDIAEDGTHGLDQWVESGAGNYTLTIKPDADAMRTISGDAAAGLIRLNGADRVIINGSNNSTETYLSFNNLNTSGTGSAFTFTNGAMNNSLSYLNAQAAATNGVIFFGTSAIAGGNSNNLVNYCTISASVGSIPGDVGIYSAGTAVNENSSNIISNNIVSGYRNRGLDITATGSSAWMIADNSFFNGNISAGINYPASSTLHGIRILGGSGYSILNNSIGGSTNLAAGTTAEYSSTLGNISYEGILLHTTSATPVSEIKRNTIASIAITSVPTSANSTAFTGIGTSGAGVNIGGNSPEEGNIVGSASVNSSIVVNTSTTSALNTTNIIGISTTSTGGIVNNNQVGGFDISNAGSVAAPSLFQGIFVNAAAAPTQVNNNLVGSTSTPNSIQVLPGSTSATTALKGISIGSAVNSIVQVSGNRVENIDNLSTTASGNFTGIDNSATLSDADITISADTIQYVNTAANANNGTMLFSGIRSSSAATISNNLVNHISLSSTGTNAQVIGIHVSGVYPTLVSGNIVENLSTASQKPATSPETNSPTSSAIIGLLNSTTSAGQIIKNNRITALTATSTAPVSVTITAVGITSTGSGSIFNNRFGQLTNTATGTAPAIILIKASDGSFNVYNNTLRISNLAYTNGVHIYGFVHAALNSWNYFHNTVRASGHSNGRPLRSAAFILSVNSSPVLKNNILFNIRTGTGSQHAISNLASPPAAWPSTASDYNNLYTSDPATVGEWGTGSNVTFEQWKTSSGGDEHSISDAISFIQSPYDLQPDSITNCKFNNAGTPITTPVSIDTDIDSTLRNPVAPDLGAYEFNYSGFTITGSSNSPICSGDSIYLTVDAGEALMPSYSWRDSANQEISTVQSPVIALVPGLYTITVTDSTGCLVTDSVVVIENQRPTATLTSQTSLCDSGYVAIKIAVTGTGTINGTLSNGDEFSGRAPLIEVSVFMNTTTSISITALSDSVCTSIPSDIPDTLTVSVTHQGDWLGINSNWNDPVNWCGGIVPTSATHVVIPAGTNVMPVITDTAYCKNLTISSGDSLTISTTGTLMIAGSLTNNGTFTDRGTTNFNGTSGQQTFAGVPSFNNFILDNTNGLGLPAPVLIRGNLTIRKGTLVSNNYNVSIAGNWFNNASSSAFNAGSSTVTFIDSALQVIAGAFSTTFSNLVILKTLNPVVLSINTSITGNLTVASGIFDLAAFTANRATPGGAITISNNSTLKIGGTNSFPVNYSTKLIVVASNVEYSGSNQLVSNQEYGNLILSSSVGSVVKTLPNTALLILGNLTTRVGSGTSVTVNAAANVSVKGNVSIGTGTAVNGGSYLHDISGNWLNLGGFNGNSSTVTFSGTNKTVGGAGNQNFNNLTISASGIVFSGDTLRLTGNFATIGSGSLNQGPGGTLVMNGTAKTITGTGITLTNLLVNGTVTTSATMAITGNLAVAGGFTSQAGIFSLNGASKTISGSGSMKFFNLSIAGSYSSLSDFTITSGIVVDGSFVASAGTATFTGASTLSGNANLYNVNINGISLRLAAGSVLGIANTFTIINGTLDVTASRPNTVNYNGARPQSLLAINYSNLVLSNGNVKTASGSLTTLNDLTIASGTSFNPGSYTHNIFGNWVNNGTFVAGTSTIQFSGPMTSFITGPTTFNILNSNTSAATTQLILQNNVSASIVNMISGNINTGTNTLTITGTRTGDGIILGNIIRNHDFTPGIAYAFEGPQNTVTFSTVTGVNSVRVSIQKGSVADFPFGGSIGRVYEISVPSGTYNATLRLHYEDDELNGNAESSMSPWHYNGSAWSGVGKSGNSTSLNYVEQNGLTDINNRWTLSDNSNLVQWNGSISSDWNTAGNWTVLQGSGSRPPSPTDIVDLGTATFLNQPLITSDVTVKNIVFGSVQEVTLTLGVGGSLTTMGDISGNWTGNATHNINVNDQVLTVNGNINLSDSTMGHAINLNVGAGTVTTLASLSQTGGANIIFTGAGLLNIHQDFTSVGGTFTTGSSTVVYNGDENQHVAHLTYNNLTINKGDGFADIDSPINITGDLLIASGVLENHSTTSIGGNVIIDTAGSLRNFDMLRVRGNWINNGDYVSTGASTIFEGTGTQTISPTTFHNLTINKPSGTAELTGEVVATGDFKLLSGIFDFKTYSVTRQVAGGTTLIANGAVALIGGNNGPVNFTTKQIDLNSTIIYNGSDLQVISSEGISYGNIIFRNGGANPKVLVTPASIKGNLTIEQGATLNGATVTINLQGNWTNNGTFNAGTGNVILAGTTKILSGPTTFYRSSITGSYNVVSDIGFDKLFEITSSGSITTTTAISTIVRGNLENNGVLITNGTATFTGDSSQSISLINATTLVRKVNFNGSVSPVLYSTTPVQFNIVNIANTGGINPTVSWTIFDTLNISNGASFNGGISTHILYGNLINNGTITSTGVLNFIPGSAVLINLGNSFSSTGTVIFGGAGLMTLAGNPTALYNLDVTNTNLAGVTPGAGWNITNNFTVASGSLFNAGNYNFLVGGNLSNRGVINSGSSTFTLNGAASQDVYNISPFNNLTINKTGGSAILSFNATVTGVLNFVAGNIQTGVNVLIQPSSGSITNAGQSTGWVNGKYQKYIPTGAPARNFEVGDASRYAPVSLVFSNVSTAGSLIASSIQGDHPNIGISQINRQKNVNRYWTLTNNGIVFTHYSAVYNFAAADVDAQANTAAFKVALFNGSSWSMPASSLPNPLNIRATTVTAFGSFAAGEVCNVGTTISYPGSPFCTSSGIILPTRNGTAGGTYSSTSGLSINSTTGAINLGSSNGGTYRVTYTVAATSECAAFSTFVNITVTTQPFANGVYNGTPYCVNGGIVYPTGTRQSGALGKISSSPGLSIDSTSGAVNLGLSLPGTYTITYTVAPSGGCGFYSNSTTIVINPVPSATISYGGTPYCASAGIVTVTQTGSTGGKYTSTPGLAIDTLTGSINTGQSIPGNYTIHYNIAANGCAAFTTAYDVEITALPSASIVYNGSPFCNIPGTASPTITGTTGGSFHSTPGLMIDSATGVITLGTSTPGNYIVTYFMAASDGCASASTTTPVTVSVSPSATITYEGNPFSNTGTRSVTRTGTAGGVYSSSEGLVINPESGLVNLATSAIGVYEVLYTISAGGCEPFEARTTITIYSLPVVNSGFAPDLKTAANFVLFTINGPVGNTRASLITGNIGTNVGAITGFGATPIACARHTADALTVRAASDVTAAYNQLDTITPTAIHEAVLGDGETLYAGVYSIATAGSVTSVLNLDAQGNPDAVFIFKIGGAFNTVESTVINLLNGATSCNVFWKVEGAISLAASTQMKGTLIANGAISMAGGSTLDGRLFSTSAGITVDAVTASLPACFRRITSWTGASGTDWNNACNWLYAEVPTGTTNITIPSALVNYPVLSSGIGSIENLAMENGATLTVSNALLQVSGNILNAGTINAQTGSIEFNGSTEQTIPAATFGVAGIKSLSINNNASVTLGGPLSIIDVLTIAQGSLVTGGYLTLKSSATGTARVARITSSALIPINGNVRVERFIPGRRKYRLLTSSVTTSTANELLPGQENLSIWGNWQNQGNNVTAKNGNLITGGTQADGFDQQSQNASMFTYDEVRRAFTPFSTANGNNTRYTPLKAGKAYYMFVYGDRTNSIFDATPDSTVLSATGTLLTGDQRFNTTSFNPLSNVVDRFSLLGNPFASPVDWSTISRTNLADTYWGWDPNLSSTGGYVTVSSIGNTTLISPFSGVTGLNQFIQPGQGFFVKTTAPFPVLTIREQDKTSNFNSNAFRTTSGSGTNNLPLLAINLLYDRSGVPVLADGALAAFDPAFSSALSREDAAKLLGSGEWLGLANGGQLLSIDGRPMPTASDTLAINMSKLTKPSYTLQIFANAMADKDVRPYLEDAYLHSSVALSVTDTNLVTFSVDPSVAASSEISRFRITFRKAVTQRQEAENRFPYHKMDLINMSKSGPGMKVYPNPVVNQQINLHLVEIEKGSYTFIMQNSQGQQLSPLKVEHRGGTSSHTIPLKQKLAAGIYYLHLNYKKVRYSQVIVIE